MLKRISLYAMIFLGVVLSLLEGCFGKRAGPERYLIPRGYTGPVVVIFNKPNGQPQKFEKGTRIYEIPQNGILLTQFMLNDGIIPKDGLQFFYVNNVGSMESILWHPPKGSSTSDVQILFLRVGHAGENYYKAFVVGRKSNKDSLFTALEGLDISKY